MAISLLDHIGPDSLPGRFVATVRNLAGMETLDPISGEGHDLDTVLRNSQRVYRAEPSRLWDSRLDDDKLDRQWSRGAKAVQDREVTDWDLEETDITFYHIEHTLTYEARATVRNDGDQETLLYVGELAYDLPAERLTPYMEADQETVTAEEAYRALDGEISVSQWVFDEPDQPPQYRDDTGRDRLDAYLDEVDITEAELTRYDDGDRAAFHGEHPSYGSISIIASTGRDTDL